ncbi:MAG: hypothetical protein ACYCXF_07115 [Thermoleophilia bacterium]
MDKSNHYLYIAPKRNFFNDKGQVIGCVENGVLKKRVRKSRHFLNKPPAIAMDWTMIQTVRAENLAVCVEVYEAEEEVTYTCSLETLYKRGFRLNRGYGEQWALNISKWNVVLDENQQQLF